MSKPDDSRRDRYDPAVYDPDMRLPPAVLHFFPVVLALFTLTMSVAGRSIFHGFDEGEPITWMSTALMLTVLVFLVAVIRDRALEPVKRWAAVVLSAVTVFAILDERQRWHEKFGRYVKNDLDFFTRDIRHYTDDAVVVVFALAGALLLYLFVRKLKNRRDYVPYVACAVALAVAHGLLDVLGHGGRLWRALIPEITKHQVALLTETLGFFEEACKLWAEWFVLLFVLRFFHRQRGPLAWSMLVMTGSFLSGIGLWAIEDPSAGVPYVVMERTLRFLRNYHLLIALAAVFSTWAIVSWRLFGEEPRKQAMAGWFFVAPFYAVLPEIARAVTGVLDRLGFPGTVLATAALLAVIAYLPFGARAQALARAPQTRYRALAIVAVAAVLGLVGFSTAELTSQPLLLLSIGGVIFPWTVAFLVRRNEQVGQGLLAGALALAAVLFQDPLWWLVAFAVAFAVSIRRRSSPVSGTTWPVLASLQAVAIAVVYTYSVSGILPEYRFDVPEKVVFETGTQEIDPDYYRSEE